MSDLISRQAAIEVLYSVLFDDDLKPTMVTAKQADAIMDSIRLLPSAQPDTDRIYAELSKAYNVNGLPDEAIDIIGDLMLSLDEPSERTEYIPDTKAVRSKRDCVDLAERVTAMFYDEEHEEWTQRTVTIADVLNSVCDEYTILPSAQPNLSKDELRLIKKLRSFHNGTYAKVLDKLIASAHPEEDCDTCKHGYFGDDKCNNCRVRYPSHYERRTDESY